MGRRKIILTGGGTAGHVTPNLALIPGLKELGYEIEYIGTADGIERKIIEENNIKYHIISSGKLRRYFDLKNFTDPFRVIKGIFEAASIIKKQKPDIVFSKGGFVSVPVVIGASLNKIPVVTHESDITPGLANKLSLPYCSKICVTFPESLEHVKRSKGVLTGSPIRKELLEGSKFTALKICKFEDDKPILMVTGGSLGSKFINDAVRGCIKTLLLKYNVIHICGRNNLDENLKNKVGYAQFEYVDKELPHFFTAADIVISRAGANTLFELLALKKPNLLIPLSAKSSRGDQILNAASFEKSGYSLVIQEEDLTNEILVDKVNDLYNSRSKYIKNMNSSALNNGVENILKVIEETRNKI